MPVKIHNKEYKTVAERIVEFYAKHTLKGTETSIHTEILKDEDSLVQVRATISVNIADVQVLYGTGHAEEDRRQGMINKTSALENAETSAIGRALASIGLGGEEFASADELVQALANQKSTAAKKPSTAVTTNSSASSEKNASTINFGKHKGKPYNKIPIQYLEWLTGRPDTDQETMELAKAEISVRNSIGIGNLTPPDDKDAKDWEVDEKIFSKVAKTEEKPKSQTPKTIEKKQQSVNEMVASIGNGVAPESPVISESPVADTPLSLERRRRDVANELTILSQVLGMEKFQEIKTREVGAKGFAQCELDELEKLKEIMDGSIPTKTKKSIEKQEELLNKVVETFDGQILSK